MSFNYENIMVREHMLEGGFGLEKESLRVDPGGYLSHTKHPFGPDPNIERDFCENQTELITKVCGSVDEVWDQLAGLHQKTVNTLNHLETGREYLWPFSNPPYVKGEADIPIASYKGKLKGKEEYREYLAGKYGKKKMLFSGIHFNFPFSEMFLRADFAESGLESYRDYKNDIYLELAKKVTRYSWLIVYLMAASPIMDGSFFRDDALGKDYFSQYSSARCSEIGYWNDFIPTLNYDSLEAYVDSIQEYVDCGQLKVAGELYYPVRLKPAGENTLENLKRNGVNHIELRMLDLNPFSPIGIFKEDIKFLHLFILYLMSLENTQFVLFEQIMAIKNEKRAAGYDEKDIRIEMGWRESAMIREAAMEILSDMEAFFADFGQECITKTLEYQKEKLTVPGGRYAVRVKRRFRHDYVKKGLELAKSYADKIEIIYGGKQ